MPSASPSRCSSRSAAPWANNPPDTSFWGPTAQMLDWMKRAGGGPTSNAGIWQLYKERDEAQRAGSGPTSNAGIWHLYRERYEAQQAGASQTPTLPPLSTLLPPSQSLVTDHQRLHA